MLTNRCVTTYQVAALPGKCCLTDLLPNTCDTCRPSFMAFQMPSSQPRLTTRTPIILLYVNCCYLPIFNPQKLLDPFPANSCGFFLQVVKLFFSITAVFLESTWVIACKFENIDQLTVDTTEIGRQIASNWNPRTSPHFSINIITLTGSFDVLSLTRCRWRVSTVHCPVLLIRGLYFLDF